MGGWGEELLTLAGLKVLALQTSHDGFFFLVNGDVEFLELRLKALDLGKIRAVLSGSVNELSIDVGAFAKEILNGRVIANLGHGVNVAGFGKFEHGLLAHALALRVSQLFVEIGDALGGDVLLVVDGPDLILPFIGDAGVLGLFNADL